MDCQGGNSSLYSEILESFLNQGSFHFQTHEGVGALSSHLLIHQKITWYQKAMNHGQIIHRRNSNVHKYKVDKKCRKYPVSLLTKQVHDTEVYTIRLLH